jgi:aldehyde:ferredoxin oxidoreductase
MPLTGKVAVIDLTSGEITQTTIPEKLRRLYLGGRGLQAYLIYNHLKPGADPMGPDNVLVVSAGILTGSMAPASARSQWGGKSPVTGAIASSNMGGFFGAELKFAGFEHLVIKGAAKAPVYLWIRDGEIEIRDASHIWGKDTFETPQLIREELEDEDIKVGCIGIAGENLVRLANFRTGPKDAAGRTGTGCIAGSKKLKAIAVRGRLGLRPAHPREALTYAKEAIDKIMMTKVAKAMGVDGTSFIWNVTNSSGLLEWMNGQTNRFPFGDWHDMTIERFHEEYSTGIVGCFNCTVHCRHQFRLKEGPLAGAFGEGPEYNTQTAFGTYGLSNWGDMLLGWHLANLYGIDTTEWCNAVRGVMELYQRGIIDKEVTGGLDLSWSNAKELTPKLLELTAKNEGIGAIIGQGAKGIIDSLGQYDEKVGYYILHCKGLGKLGNVDRIQPSFSLGIATSTRGCDHLRSRPALDHYHLPEKLLENLYGGKVSNDYTSYEGKARMVRWHELTFAVVDAIGTCKFQTVFFSPNLPCYEEWCKYLLYNTGLEFTPEELFEIGERIYTLEKLINQREAGHTRKDDYPPERSFKEAHKHGLGPVKGKRLDRKKYEKMLDEYYELHGWSKDGIPKQETLKRLQLSGEPSHIV